MVRLFAILLGLLAALLALLHGIVTLNPCSIFESGLIAVNTFVFAPDSHQEKR